MKTTTCEGCSRRGSCRGVCKAMAAHIKEELGPRTSVWATVFTDLGIKADQITEDRRVALLVRRSDVAALFEPDEDEAWEHASRVGKRGARGGRRADAGHAQASLERGTRGAWEWSVGAGPRACPRRDGGDGPGAGGHGGPPLQERAGGRGSGR